MDENCQNKKTQTDLLFFFFFFGRGHKKILGMREKNSKYE